MNPVFEIMPEYLEPQYTNLYCEISEDSLTYFFQNAQDMQITGLSLYELPDRFSNADYNVKDILDEKQILRKSYNKVNISYSFNEFTLIPYSMYSEDEKSVIMETMFRPGTEKMILSDNLANLEIHNYYSVPLYIHYYVISHFPLAKFSHEVSNLIRNYKDQGTILSVIFHQRKMIYTLWKENNLQLSSSVFFISSEDVIYQLLNICKQFGLDNRVHLSVTGMMDADSALAKELRMYFSNISYTAHSSKLADNLQHFPEHYFSHLFSLT